MSSMFDDFLKQDTGATPPATDQKVAEAPVEKPEPVPPSSKDRSIELPADVSARRAEYLIKQGQPSELGGICVTTVAGGSNRS